MSWRDSLRRVEIGGRLLIGASFRGVPFFVEEGDLAGGRRVVVHEFPLRDDPFIEDLGRKARTFRLDGYVLGEDYVTQRNKLLAALEEEGPGELVHPHHGALRAVCATLAVRESRANGGMATFALEFVDAPSAAVAPTTEDDAEQQVANSAQVAKGALSSSIATVSYLGVPSFAVASAEAAVSRASDALRDALSPLAQTTQELAQLASACAIVKAKAAALVRQPAELLIAFRAAIAAVADSALDSPLAFVQAMLDAYGVNLGSPVSGVTATRAKEAANHAAITSALRLEILIEAARLAPTATYSSIEEARLVRERVSSLLSERAATADDALYPALVRLRADVLRAVPGGKALARVVDVDRRSPVPSLLLAYQLYGSVDAEADIVARNAGRISHPGFVVGSLKVLSDV